VVLGILSTLVIFALAGIKGTNSIAGLTTINDVCQVRPSEPSEYVIQFPTDVKTSANETKSINLVLARSEDGIVSPGSAQGAYPACAIIAKLYIDGGPAISLQGFATNTLFANSYSEWTWILDGSHQGKYTISLRIKSQLLSGKSVMITAKPITASLTISPPTESWRPARATWHWIWGHLLNPALPAIFVALVITWFSPIGKKLRRRRMNRKERKASRERKSLEPDVVHDAKHLERDEAIHFADTEDPTTRPSQQN